MHYTERIRELKDWDSVMDALKEAYTRGFEDAKNKVTDDKDVIQIREHSHCLITKDEARRLTQGQEAKVYVQGKAFYVIME